MPPEEELQKAGPTIQKYFLSIEKEFHKTLDATGKSYEGYDGSGLSIVMFLFLLFSLIPVIPAIAYFSAKHFLKVWVIRTPWEIFSTDSLAFWYLSAVLTFAILFGLRLAYSSWRTKRFSRRQPVKEDEFLRGPQMRFALCYSVRAELDLYRTNRRPSHIESARLYWSQLFASMMNALGDRDDEWIVAIDHSMPESFYSRPNMLRWRRRNFFSEVTQLKSQFSWFLLDARTDRIINAFDNLVPKLSMRISEKKDLFSVSACLEGLQAYLFTRIPEISEADDGKPYQAGLQDAALDIFSERMSKMDVFIPEAKGVSSELKTAVRRERFNELLQCTVSHQTAFIRFISIWFLLQIVVGIGLWISLLSIHSLKLDSTLLALLIGSPFAVSAALTAISPRATRS